MSAETESIHPEAVLQVQALTGDLDLASAIRDQEQTLVALQDHLLHQSIATAANAERVAHAKSVLEAADPKLHQIVCNAKHWVADEEMHHAVSYEAEDNIRAQIRAAESELRRLQREQRKRNK